MASSPSIKGFDQVKVNTQATFSRAATFSPSSYGYVIAIARAAPAFRRRRSNQQTCDRSARDPPSRSPHLGRRIMAAFSATRAARA
eukprot:3597933-Pyramimonas_sp.AAC.1